MRRISRVRGNCPAAWTRRNSIQDFPPRSGYSVRLASEPFDGSIMGPTFWARTAAAAAIFAGLAHGAAAAPANCHNSGSFDAWLAKFKQEAEQQGISRAAI